MKTIFFDTETSGLNCNTCKIIELAMITVVDGRIIEEYDKFIKINECLSPEITSITGITDKMLEKEGENEEIIAHDLKERLSEGTLMIAHNAQFDLMFIYSLLKRHYPSEAYDIISGLKWMDTLTVFKDRKPYPHKLIDAVNYYNIGKVNFHRAIDDTKALYEVTKALRKERDDLAEYINIFGYNPRYGPTGIRFAFIEYKPQPYTNRTRTDNILPRR